LLIAGAIALGIVAIRISSGGRDVDLWRVVRRMLLVAVVVARLAYVFQYRVGYLQDWQSFFNLRDGGWDAEAGIVAAWLYAVIALKGRHAARTPLIAALSVVSVVWGVGSVALAMMEPDRPLSTVSVATAGGTSAALSDFRGKPVLVNLWATWCPPCQRELPLLERAQLGNPDIEFVFLNEGEAGPLVAAFLETHGLPLRNVLLDIKGQAGAEYGGGALPTTLLFDAQGSLVRTHVGELSAGTLAESIDLLRKRNDAQARHSPTVNSQ
jgi:thiol-disulfide isomerase/thioredoxin